MLWVLPPGQARGFTLAELLLVITILGILSAIAIPKFLPQTEKARVSEAVAVLNAIRQGEKSYFLEQGEYLAVTVEETERWSVLGLDDPNTEKSHFLYEVTVDNSLADPSLRTFSATATRKESDYEDRTLIIDQDGAFTGTHPFRPEA